MKKSLQFVGAVALTFAVGGAQAVPLTDLLNGASITAGDKVFDQWRIISEIYSDAALTVDTDDIEVTALNDGGLDPGPGLQFTINNGAMDVTGDGIFAFIDYMFGFRVTPAAGFLIKDVSLDITSAFVTNSGFNGMAIQEFVGTDPSLVEVPGDISLPDLAVIDAEFYWADPGPAVLPVADAASFAPHNSIYVSKDILVYASDVNETASLTEFTQRFSQVAVPVPGPLALIALGLVGLGWSRRSS